METNVVVFSSIMVGIGIAALCVVGFVFSRLYERASKGYAFVRTGLGGEKVVMDNGAIILPVFHEITPVNMNTLRLEVSRQETEALITRDRMRVDIGVEFYVRVKPDKESVSRAAQTLGSRTMNLEELKHLIEGKFIDALRSSAAKMAMAALHEQRQEFINAVQDNVSEELLQNGLELETVSLTSFDQTSKKYFNPENIFDAEGLTKLTEETENRRKIRNQIERRTEVEIEQTNRDTVEATLRIAQERRILELDQERNIRNREAEQEREIAVQRSVELRLAEEKRIDTEKAVKIQESLAKRETEEAAVEADLGVRAAELKRTEALKIAEQTMEISVAEKSKAQSKATAEADEARVLAAQVVKTAEIKKSEAIRLAEQEMEIAIAEKSKENSKAATDAATARKEAVEAEEAVITAKEVAEASRQKQVRLTKESEAIERDAMQVTVSAEAAEKAAKLDASARRALAEALEFELTVQAKGRIALNEADNILSDAQMAFQRQKELLKNLQGIIEASVKPIEQIDSFRVANIAGLNSGNAQDTATAGAASGSLSDQIVNGALKYRAHAPLVDSLLKSVDIDGLGNLSESLAKFSNETLALPDSSTSAGDAKAVGSDVSATDTAGNC